MTAQDECFFGMARQGGPAVAGSIKMMLDGEVADYRLKPAAGLEPGGAPGEALGSVFIGGERPELLEQNDCALRINRHELPLWFRAARRIAAGGGSCGRSSGRRRIGHLAPEFCRAR